MAVDLVTTDPQGAAGVMMPASAIRGFPRLLASEPRPVSHRRSWAGTIGSMLLELPWLAWITLDAAAVSIGVYLGHIFAAWGPGGAWLRVGVTTNMLVQCSVFLFSAMVFGLYEQQTLLRHSRILSRSLLSTVFTVILTSIILHVLMYEELSRRALMFSGMFYLVAVPPIRMLIGWCVNHHSRRFVIVGTDRRSCLSLNSPDLRGGDGLSRRYQLIGYICLDSLEIGRRIDGQPVIGTIEDLEDICLEHGIDEVVVGPGPARQPQVLERALRCLKLGCRVTNLTTFYEQVMSEVPLAHLEPQWFLLADFRHWREAQLIMKRAFDLVGAVCGLLLTLPFWPLIALVIRMDSRGPVFYSQQRVGLNGRVFRLYKFRTMRTDSERHGHVWASEDDPRVTRVGWYLRRSRLDELPQLWNILLGHMSVVGPRPERPEFVDELGARIRFYQERHLIKPGLTGWAQINYRYGASVDDARRKLQLDLWYIKHMSLELDCIILLRTIGTLCLGSR